MGYEVKGCPVLGRGFGKDDKEVRGWGRIEMGLREVREGVGHCVEVG